MRYSIERGDQLAERIDRAEKGRNISLNQTFKFSHEYMVTGGGPAGFMAYNRFHLSLDDSKKINVTVLVSSSLYDKKRDVITPLDPKQGYEITDEDCNIEKRKRKTELLKDKEVKGNPLCLEAFIPEEEQSLLDYLRFVVKIGDVVLESRPSEKVKGTFCEFYPQEKGPLPVDEKSELNEGLTLNVPYRVSAVESIEMKFILVREKPQATPNNR